MNKGETMVPSFLKKVPILLIAARGGIGLLAVLVSLAAWDPTGVLLVSLVVAGLLSDVFDGIAARRFGVSDDALRIWDSRIDVLFFVCLVAALLIRSPNLLPPVGLFFLGISVLEVSVHLISFVRFGKQSSTHHYLSKAFSVLLFGLLVQLFLDPVITWFFWVVAGAGVVSFAEAAWIMLTLKTWRCDIRSFLDLENGEVRVREERPSTSGK